MFIKKISLLTTVIISLTGCVKNYYTSGHLFEKQELAKLHQAKTKEDVEEILGSPSSVSSFGIETWFYITSKKEQVAFFKSKIIEQNIVEISFNKDNSINTVMYYNENNAKEIKLIEEFTVSKGTDTSTMQKFFYNVGRFRGNKQVEPAKPRSGF